MKNKTVILAMLFSFSMGIGFSLSSAKTDKDISNIEKSNSEIIIYLKSGEIIKGNLIEKTANGIVIKKMDNILSFKLDDILQIKEDTTGNMLSKLPFSTAIITYEYKGWQQGKETAYVDTVNNKIAIETITTVDIGDTSVETTQIAIYDGETLYTYESGTEEAVKMEIEGDIISQMFGEQLYIGNPIRQETFLNKECTTYETAVGDMYFWYGILLKEVTKRHPMGEKFNFTKEAVDIKLDTPIPSDKFILPEGIRVKTMDDMFKNIEKMSKEIEESQKEWELEAKKIEEERKVSDQIRTLIDAGRIYENQERYTDAIAKYTEAIALNPSKSEGYDARFRVYEITGENKKAVDDISILIEMNLPYAQDIRFSERADIYSRIGKYKEAIDDYTKALEEKRKFISEEIKKKKELFKRIGEDEEEIEWTEQYSYQIAAILESRGNAYRKMGQYDKTIKDFTEGINQNPIKWLKAKLYFLRGLTYKQMNELANMAEDWKVATSLGNKLHEGEYIGQEKHGQWVWYYQNGNVKTEGNYVRGKKDGEWKWYNEDGTLRTKATYKNDIRL